MPARQIVLVMQQGDGLHGDVGGSLRINGRIGATGQGRGALAESVRFPIEDRRRHERVRVPAITLQVEGRSYLSHNWSLGGFMIEGYEGRLTPGALFILDRIALLDGSMAEVRVRARVVRADDASRRLVVSFLDLDERAYAILNAHMIERMRVLKGHRPV